MGKYAQRSIIKKLTKYSDAVVHIPVFYSVSFGLDFSRENNQIYWHIRGLSWSPLKTLGGSLKQNVAVIYHILPNLKLTLIMSFDSAGQNSSFTKLQRKKNYSLFV